jgi:hypothetical protein
LIEDRRRSSCVAIPSMTKKTLPGVEAVLNDVRDVNRHAADA